MPSGTQSWHERLFRVFGDKPVRDGGDETGVFSFARNSLRVFSDNESQFGESLVVERTPIIQLNSAFGVNEPLRDRLTLTGSASSDDVNGTLTTGEIQLSTGAGRDSVAQLQSSEVGRYIPGFSAELGIGIRVPTAPTGEQELRFGGITSDDNNGFYFLYDATGIACVRLRNGTETLYRQTDWNIDKLDGNGLSGITLDATRGKVYQVDWTWYGYGQIVFSVLGVINNRQNFVPVHQISSQKDYIGTSVTDPSLRVTVEAKNNDTAQNIDIFVGGRQYSVIGRYIPKYRYTGDVRVTSVSTTRLPLISFRHKTAFRNRSVKLLGYSISNRGNDPAYIEIVLGGTLTGASWGTPNDYNAADTALESDTSATAISGGNVVYAGDIAPAGQGSAVAFAGQDIDLDLPEEVEVTLCATSFSGSNNIVSGFRMKEEW